MKKTPILLSLSILTIYACTCVSAVQFNPGPLDEECLEAGIEEWVECEDFLSGLNDCEPSCEEWQECGDDGCGGECGRCPNAAPFCNDGFCEQVCTPDCDDKECGGDGCGDVCGDCPVAAPFCIEFLCSTEEPDEPESEECVPDCDNRECGPDNCESQCGTCEDGDICVYSPGASECIAEEETSSCEGLCGAFTGSCWCDEACFINDDCCDDVCDFCSEDEAIAKECDEAAAE